jgi:hypothetical protein
MSWLDGLIPLCAVVFGGVAALAVSLVEYRGANEREDSRGPINWTRQHPIRPLLAGLCTAALAAGSAAEFTTANFGPDAQDHPVLIGALTGAALLGITVLVIEALLQRVAAQSWQPSLEATWRAVVKAGRRGADDIADELGDERHHVTADALPKSRTSEAEHAYEAATSLQFEIGLRVDRASHAAFAAGQSELDDALHEAFTAADDLQRVLYRWFTGGRSRTAGAPRTPIEVEERWRHYLESLVRLHRRGLDLDFEREMPKNYATWIEGEVAELKRIAELREIAERESAGQTPGG